MNYYHKTLISFFTIFFLIAGVQAQHGSLLRGEISTKDYDFIYFVPINNNGLLNIKHGINFRSSNDNL